MKLILRTTNAHWRLKGLTPDWGPDDYLVIDGSAVVGRIYPEAIHGEPKWLWFLQTVPAAPPNRGHASSLEEAKAAFKARYEQVKGTR